MPLHDLMPLRDLMLLRGLVPMHVRMPSEDLGEIRGPWRRLAEILPGKSGRYSRAAPGSLRGFSKASPGLLQNDLLEERQPDNCRINAEFRLLI